MKRMIRMQNGLLILLLLMAQMNFAQEKTYNWQELFNGKDLKGWKKLNGTAKYMIDGDAIVGISELNTPNTFLATEKMYTDFILEVDLKVDNLLNSGIQIRSNSMDSYRDGRVHGYQVEIDPSPRAYSGGLYDEARRGWLYPLSRNPKGREAFRTGEWNHYRIECIGNNIRTWVNGIMCTNLADAETAEGFIALQVHGIRNEEQSGTKVMWKNIKVLTEDLESARWKADPEVDEISYLENKLTENETREGWRLLWDGKSSAGWRGAKLDDFPESGWQMQDGILTILETDGAESTGPGDIITTDQFSEFELELDFMITEGANSGVKYFVDPTLNKGTGSAIGLEFQILDDKVHPDAKKGVSGNRTLGSLYDLIRADNLSVPNRNKTFKGVDSWNKARIVVKGNHVEHWLNNEKVVEFERGSQIFRALVAYSKYKNWPEFGEYPQGPILLQDHGNTVHYKSIKIREF
jgi:hypothetical protein